MSTKKSHRTKNEILQDQHAERELAQKSVIAELQAVVEELKARGMTDIDLHSLLNMIFQGWLIAGQPTKEYLELDEEIKKLTKRKEELRESFLDSSKKYWENNEHERPITHIHFPASFGGSKDDVEPLFWNLKTLLILFLELNCCLFISY